VVQFAVIVDNITLIRIVSGLIAIIFLPIIFVPYWRIFSKAGFSGWLFLLMIVPLVNLIVLYYVAFASWNVKPEKSN